MHKNGSNFFNRIFFMAPRFLITVALGTLFLTCSFAFLGYFFKEYFKHAHIIFAITIGVILSFPIILFYISRVEKRFPGLNTKVHVYLTGLAILLLSVVGVVTVSEYKKTLSNVEKVSDVEHISSDCVTIDNYELIGWYTNYFSVIDTSNGYHNSSTSYFIMPFDNNYNDSEEVTKFEYWYCFKEEFRFDKELPIDTAIDQKIKEVLSLIDNGELEVPKYFEVIDNIEDSKYVDVWKPRSHSASENPIILEAKHVNFEDRNVKNYWALVIILGFILTLKTIVLIFQKSDG